ncbi:MAG: hypothetical protein SGJ24_05340 [Chloroflexota bacterium]|nr:hypothetical protein [Chloroflexota bacterium]
MSDEKLSDHPFAYTATKNGKVLISWYGKQVTILAGEQAAKFLKAAEGADDDAIQQLMARVTGNFKRGNEKLAKKKNA